LRITSGGNVGIGTTSPNSRLHVGANPIFGIDGRTAAIYGSANSETIFTVSISGLEYPQLLDFGVNSSGLYSTISARQFTTTENRLILQPNGGNVGIGTTSPAARLTVSGTGVETHINNGDTNTLTLGNFSSGRHFIKSINLGVALTPLTLQASSFTFDTGNVGIGTTSPSARLEINAASASSILRVLGGGDGTGGGKGNIRSGDQGGTNFFDFGRDNLSTGNFVLTSGGGSPLLSITTSGATTFSSSVTATLFSAPEIYNNTGFPHNTLFGSGADATTTTIRAGSTSGFQSAIFLEGGNVSNTIKFNTASAERMRITSGGRVGIGITAPEYQLHVQDNNDVGTIAFGPSGYLGLISCDANAAELRISNRSSTFAGFISFYPNGLGATAGNERMRITASGTVQPGANGTQDLGTSSLRWATVFTSDLSLSNGIGDYTIVEGENDLFLYNNKQNKVYKFVIEEVDPSTATPKKS
jgi:hypothetical protein